MKTPRQIIVLGTQSFLYVAASGIVGYIMEDVGGDKLYGLDGSVVAWVNDANGDGDVLDASDHVYLYITMRRGGKNIYANS